MLVNVFGLNITLEWDQWEKKLVIYKIEWEVEYKKNPKKTKKITKWRNGTCFDKKVEWLYW